MDHFYRLAAELILVVHGLIVGFNVFGLCAIFGGLLFRWQWTRNPYFRWAHLITIGIVGIQGAFGVLCPLTVLEDHLRQMAGQEPEPATFISRWIHRLIFVNVPLPILNAIYIGAAAFVVGAMFFFPPRAFPGRKHVDNRLATSESNGP